MSRITADWREGCTPTAPSRIGRSKVMFRSWLLRSIRWEYERAHCSMKCSIVSSTFLHRESKDRVTGVTRKWYKWAESRAVQVSRECCQLVSVVWVRLRRVRATSRRRYCFRSSRLWRGIPVVL